ncbi:hypothetical protein [Evansella clarkii]|uniref:hypothetical protein n=1 Tax=Evansella clarkii TaxID=79879 RepID=UPI00142FE2A1|nr:hypothetical protein [Evansella clarkii]
MMKPMHGMRSVKYENSSSMNEKHRAMNEKHRSMNEKQEAVHEMWSLKNGKQRFDLRPCYIRKSERKYLVKQVLTWIMYKVSGKLSAPVP